MKIWRPLACTAILLLLCAPGFAQETVYQVNAESTDDGVVNSYSNVGAQRYRRAMASRSGTIRNLVPKEDPAFSTTALTAKSIESRPRATYRSVTPDKIAQLVEREGKKNGVDPLLLEIIIQHESNFNPSAVSPTGAQGLMQLMPSTAAGLGVADPFDPEQNVAGGALYFAQQLRRFGDVGRALAAYNAGPGAVESFGGVPPYAETQNYVASISAEYNARRRQAQRTEKPNKPSKIEVTPSSSERSAATPASQLNY